MDWQNLESAPARLRVLLKRILREYGYPPDLQDGAVETVLTGGSFFYDLVCCKLTGEKDVAFADQPGRTNSARG